MSLFDSAPVPSPGNADKKRPLADLPVREVLGGLHMLTDMTLPYGKVIHDYLA